MKSKWKLLVLSLLCLLFLCGCQREQIELQKTGLYFDTVVTITVRGQAREKDKLEAALSDAMETCQTYENMLSRTVAGSDIDRINNAGSEWTSVSDETIRVLYTALNYCDMTEGHIDVTIAGMKELWNFSSTDHAGLLPNANLLENQLLCTDYRQVEIDGSKVRLGIPNAQLDLGFIAKGFIADEIKARLIEDGISSALIDLGGNILVLGEKSENTPFQVGIRKPFADASETLAVVEASDSLPYNTVVTSGIYERYFTYNDKIYHHILDAKTGYPVENNLLSVTILADSSMNADALSTTCLVMGLDWSRELLAGLDGVDAIFVTDEMEVIDTRK